MTTAPPQDRTRRPVLALVLLGPLLGEVISGATRFSYLFAYVPEVMMWGCGALLLRDIVRRWGGTWRSMLPLALALSVWEEFLVQQTSLAPFPWPGAVNGYGRYAGVNWAYFLFMLAFESVTITLVPVRLVELLFPRHAARPWLDRRGLAVAGTVFLLGSSVAWYLWIKVARVQVFHAPDYVPHPALFGAGALAIVLLFALGSRLRRIPPRGATRAPAPLIALGAATLLAAPWYALMALVFVPWPRPPALWIPVAGALAWSLLTLALAARWSRASGWGERHDAAVVLGVALVCGAAGYLGSATWPRQDVLFKAALDAAALAGLLALQRRVRARTAAQGA